MKDKVLVVEGEMQIRLIYKRLLDPEGLEAIWAQMNLADIRRTFVDHQVDIKCVISAGMLNGFNGVDIVKVIRDIDSSIPILAVTSCDDLAKEMIMAGANAWLLKPFQPKELLQEISALIFRHPRS